ncbi:MAG: PAS domain S-box protein [Thermoanaerobaculia bacterium]|nr:PAS domain S-box protein [Thermoanaerobaculia bacterium]
MEHEPATDLRLRAAVESSPSGLLMIDAEGRIVLVNREVERLFGYSREELLGRPIETLVPERFRASHPGSRSGFFRSPSVRAMGAGRELFGLRKDGSEIRVEIGLTPVATQDGLFVISSIVDISARLAAERARFDLEEQLRQSQKLEALGRLAGGVAHDFNNILASIVGYAELVQGAVDRPEVKADLEQLLRAAERGRELVERILLFSRRQEVRRRPLDFGQVVRDSVGLLRPALPAGIELALDLDKAPKRILADPTSMQQVLMNLVSNAADASGGVGRVEVGATEFYVRDSFARAHPGLREGSYARLSVRDSGSGMDETTRARAFEPFFTTKQPGRGSGLGLAMVHGIVRDHGGAVWIDSQLGEGTTVSCLLPLAEMEAEVESVVEADAPRGSGEAVLLVDDEPNLVEIGRRRLAGLGYEVTTATSAEEAVALFGAAPGRFALVITDLSMPRVDGLGLARRLREIDGGTRVVLMTGYVEELSSGELAGAGIQAVLKKPMAAADLARAVAQALRGVDGDETVC